MGSDPCNDLSRTDFQMSITRSRLRLPFRVSALLGALGLAGCIHYSPDPLPANVDLAGALPIQITGPLNLDAVGTIAVLNNPDLRSQRAKSKIAEAQAFAAGILPNPQLTAELVQPTNQGDVGGSGYSFGLAYDIQNLWTQSAKVGAANAARDQARLDLLWQEWQTVAQARTLYIQGAAAAEKRELYINAEGKYAAQSDRSSRALMVGDVTFDAAAVDLGALLDSRSQLRTAERMVSQTDHQLRALLGLGEQVDVRLQPLMSPPIPDRPTIEAALAKVAEMRPDLKALQYGYQSQEENLRKSVLSQFPSLQLGVNRLSDTAGDTSSFGNVIHAYSIGATLSLPLFDRNQGDIAVQTATRAQLRAEYQTRLDQTTSDAWRIWTEMQELNRAIQDIEAVIPQLQMNSDAAERAYQSGDLSALTYVTLQTQLLNRQAELSDLRQSLWSDAIALSSVIGTQIQPQVEMKEPAQ